MCHEAGDGLLLQEMQANVVWNASEEKVENSWAMVLFCFCMTFNTHRFGNQEVITQHNAVGTIKLNPINHARYCNGMEMTPSLLFTWEQDVQLLTYFSTSLLGRYLRQTFASLFFLSKIKFVLRAMLPDFCGCAVDAQDYRRVHDETTSKVDLFLAS